MSAVDDGADPDAQSVADVAQAASATTAPVAAREVEDASGPGAIFYGRSTNG